MGELTNLHSRIVIQERYIIDNPPAARIGSGRSGEIFLGRDTRNDKDVAVKVLKIDPGQSQGELISRFKREGKALEKLSHPNIVDILETVSPSEETDSIFEGYCIVMEYVDGGSLKEQLGEKESLPIERALEIARDLSDALAYAHSRGVIHRDVKPGNVLLAADGSSRLTDFGLAKLEDSTSLTGMGYLMGTLSYLSPEQCKGERPDQRSDIWSFGILLWEMLVGKQPFQRKNPGATLASILSDPLPEIEFNYPGIGDRLETLLKGLLEKDPEERIGSMRLVSENLAQALDDLSQHEDASGIIDTIQSGNGLTAGLRAVTELSTRQRSLWKRRWLRDRSSVWSQANRASLGGALLVLYGVATPSMMKYTIPETYELSMSYLNLPSYYLISMILFSLYGFLQGLAVGFTVSCADVILDDSNQSRLRPLVGAVGGIVSLLYFSWIHLLADTPAPAPTSVVVIANVIFALAIGFGLSRVIPPFYIFRDRRQQLTKMAGSALLLGLLSIPHVYFIYEEQAAVTYPSRIILAVLLPIAVGCPFLFQPSRNKR